MIQARRHPPRGSRASELEVNERTFVTGCETQREQQRCEHHGPSPRGQTAPGVLDTPVAEEALSREQHDGYRNDDARYPDSSTCRSAPPKTIADATCSASSKEWARKNTHVTLTSA